MAKEWVGGVYRSPIDSRVWVAVLPFTDTSHGVMGASTSLRRCKAHVAKTVASWGSNESDLRWQRLDDGDWEAFIETKEASDG